MTPGRPTPAGADPDAVPPADAAPARPSPLWRRQAQAGPAGRRRALLVVAGLMLVPVGGIALLLSWVDPVPPPSLLVVGASPPAAAIPQWPGDARALAALDGFAEVVDPGPGAVNLPGVVAAAAQSAGPGRALVVYLAARAWVAGAGPAAAQVRLARADADWRPGAAPEGFALEDVVRALGGPRRVLLLLDLHPPPPDPRSPAPPAAGGLDAVDWEALARSRKDLAILVSSEDGRPPVGSPALGRSAFGYYVERGLGGAADRPADGRLTARELAGYVADGVARWSTRLGGGLQAPRLFGADFAVRRTPHAAPGPAALPKEATPYPPWLADSWRRRDDARAGAIREAPRPFAQVEAALLRAEGDWIGGADEAATRDALRDRLARLDLRADAVRALPRPAPRSLARARDAGALDDADLARAVRELMAKRPRPAPGSRPEQVEAADSALVADFYAKQALASDFALAAAVVGVAAADPEPALDVVAFLDRLLAARQPRPIYAEAEALRLLARTAPARWRPARARLALALAVRGEAAQGSPLATAERSTAATLDDADRLRHEAEALLALGDYADPAEVDRQLLAALGTAEALAARVAAIAAARRLLDDAARLLPAAVPLLEADEDLERGWLAAAARARQLVEADAAGTLGDLPASVIEVLRDDLAPFEAPAVAARVARVADPAARPGPRDAGELAALLASPLPTADQRVALWKATIALQRRLIGEILRLDEADGPTSRPAGPGAAPPVAPGRWTPGRLDRISAALLALAGPDPATSTGTATGWADLGAGLAGRDVAARDRLARIAPPREFDDRLDRPESDPTRARRAAEFDSFRRWLHARYAFEAVDPAPSEFYDAAARDYSAPGDATPPGLQVDVGPASPRLDPDRPAEALTIRLRASGGPGREAATAAVRVTAGDGARVDVRPESRRPAGELSPTPLPRGTGWPIRVAPGGDELSLIATLRPDGESAGAAPAGATPPGLLVRSRWLDRTYHRAVPVVIETEADRLRVELAAGPEPTAPGVGDVLLRPAAGRAYRHLRVRNPGDRDRPVEVRLFDRRGPIPGATAALTVPARDVARVTFGPPPANPDADFREVHGPLTIRVTEPGRPGVAAGREVAVGLLPASSLVRVVDARYEPPGLAPGGRSRLAFRLRALGSVAGTPCPVEMVLDAARIPGLLSPGEGTFRATLRKEGDEVTLFAEEVALDDRGEENGVVTLTVDGIPRALTYRTRFLRLGRATTPVPALGPALRIRGVGPVLAARAHPVTFEVDGASEGSRVTLELGQYLAGGVDRFEAAPPVEVDAGRGVIRLNVRGPDGALAFEATARDPGVEFDFGQVRGRRVLRARLLDARDREEAVDELPLTVDDRAPEAVRFVDLPRYAARGGAAALRATGSSASGVREVVFFLGRPVDGKRPPTATAAPGRPDDPGRATWSAALPMQDAKLGPAEVTAEFVGGVGLSRFATATVEVVEAVPVEAGVIRGTVRVGERPQAGLAVVVLDEKNAEKGKATTDDRGRFVVRGLAPGSYQVVSAQEKAYPTRGTAPAAVEPGKVTEVEVSLSRR